MIYGVETLPLSPKNSSNFGSLINNKPHTSHIGIQIINELTKNSLHRKPLSSLIDKEIIKQANLPNISIDDTKSKLYCL